MKEKVIRPFRCLEVTKEFPIKAKHADRELKAQISQYSLIFEKHPTAFALIGVPSGTHMGTYGMGTSGQNIIWREEVELMHQCALT